jgi:hypothetical protein
LAKLKRTARVSASIPEAHAEALARMAERGRVSVSHVVAIAIERAIEAEEGGLLLNVEPRNQEPTR